MNKNVFDKYVEVINFFETKKGKGEGPSVDLHFPWAVKILEVGYELALQEGALIFAKETVEVEAPTVYPYLPQVLVFFRDKEEVNFWYKVEANEEKQIVLLNKDNENVVPRYLLTRKAEIIREAILDQVNLEKFAEEFTKNIINSCS
jgi:hypothetical protein